MKVNVLIFTILVLLIALLTSIFRPVKVPSLYTLTQYSSAILYDKSFEINERIGAISVDPIVKALASANWDSTRSPGEGSMLLDFATDPVLRLRLSYYGSFFTIDGVEGHFITQNADRDLLAAFFTRVREDILKPYREEEKKIGSTLKLPKN